jgi:hypothetical protein
MLKLLFAGLACYAVLVLVIYLMQARMLYLADVPGRSLERTIVSGYTAGTSLEIPIA